MVHAPLDSRTMLDRIKAYIGGSTHPDQIVYAKSFFELSGFNRDGGWRYLQTMRRWNSYAGFQNMKLLELGCGFGWDAAMQEMIGHNEIVATDILPSMIDGVKQNLRRMAEAGHTFDIEPLVADACHLDFAPNSFDGVYSFEAIEHVHDLDLMFDNCIRVLKPGGILMIANDSNALNAELRDATFKMWEERDRSVDHAQFLKTVRPVEHAAAEPYAVMRENMVRQANPSLTDDVVARIVKATAGLTRTEIFPIARDYSANNQLPERPALRWCRNPETGEYAERLLDPHELVDMLRQRGMKVRLNHSFSRFPLHFLNQVQFKPLNNLLFNLRPPFVIVGRKS